MNDEIVKFLKEKIESSENSFQRDLDTTTLSLYKNGNISASIKDGELFLSITPKGEEEFLKEISYSFKEAEA